MSDCGGATRGAFLTTNEINVLVVGFHAALTFGAGA
jgi:hypothetical protein